MEKAIKAVEASTVVSDGKSRANSSQLNSQLNELEGSGASGEIDEEALDDAGKKTNNKKLFNEVQATLEAYKNAIYFSSRIRSTEKKQLLSTGDGQEWRLYVRH
jgi:hypothetical protein